LDTDNDVPQTGTRHYIGLDLGQVHEFSALAVLERSQVPGPLRTNDPVKRYDVRHLQRWPAGTPYPQIAADLARPVAALPGRPLLAIDITMVGRPVANLVRRSNLPCNLYPITITGGQHVAAGPDGPQVPKRELVSTLQVLFQTRRLRVASTLPDAALLVKELSNFKATAKLCSEDQLLDWREGAHDDLVLAVALAAWLGENQIEPYTGPLVCWPPMERREQGSEYDSLIADALARMDEEEDRADEWWRR
jgi:hypothetical protein